ncbi:MAG TPA: glycosyltransferase, partial [Chloroflexota bacterium]|nr:glycosyltransferase [Chloroflexota bacterium]
MAGHPAVSAIVCSFSEDRWEDLNAAVDSLRRQTVPPGEIIVVIDHNLALYSRARAELEGVTVIENSEARGSSGARNAGVAVSR